MGGGVQERIRRRRGIRHGRRQDTLLNPSVIVEVLSSCTEGYDRGAKFRQYRTLESLTDYLLISQESALVEHFVRQLHEEATAGQSLDRWLLTAYQGLGNVVATPSLEVELPLSEIYRTYAKRWSSRSCGSRYGFAYSI